MDGRQEPVDEFGEVGGVGGVGGVGDGAAGGEDLTALRAALLRAYPRAMPELVAGGSVGELLASLEGAQAAWERVAAVVGVEAAAVAAAPARPPVVPAGDAPAAAADPDRLPATEKIRRGLMGRRG